MNRVELMGRSLGIFPWLPLAYFIGSIPTGYLMGKMLKGIDIREHGSGNPGATNVYRFVGKMAGVATLLIDGLKGYFPVYLAMQEPRFSEWQLALIGLCAIAGHNWTCFLNFRGGKGVATSAGVFLALIPLPMLVALIAFLIALLATRHVSVGSMLGAVSLCVSTWFITASKFLTGLTVFCALLILYLHRKNIHRLMHHQEPKISFRGTNAG